MESDIRQQPDVKKMVVTIIKKYIKYTRTVMYYKVFYGRTQF